MYKNNIAGQHELANQLCEHHKKYFGDESVQYADSLYLKAKVDYKSDSVPPEEVFKSLSEAIRISKTIPRSFGPSDLNLAM